MEGKNIVGAVFGTAIKVVVIAFVVIFVYRYSIQAYDLGFRIFGEEPVSEAPGENITVSVPDGASVEEIGKTLVEKGLIEDAKLFVIQEKLSSYKDELKTGVYELNTSMTAEEMMEVMASGEEEETEQDTEAVTQDVTEESASETESTMEAQE